MLNLCGDCGQGYSIRTGCDLRPIFFKIGENGPQNVQGHLLAFQGLAVHDLLKLVQDVAVGFRHGVGQQVVNCHAQTIDQPYKGIKGEAALPSFDGSHIGI